MIQSKIDSNKVNTDFNHRGVALVEADGADDIGRSYGFFDAGWGTELGWSGDFFFSGNPAFLAANHSLNTVAFTDNTHPSARTYSGGFSGLSFDGFSSMDTVMTFRVRNLWAQPGFPKGLAEPSGTLSPSALDFDDDDKTDWILTVTPSGAVQAFDSLGQAIGNIIEGSNKLLVRVDSIIATPAIVTQPNGFTALIPSREKAYFLTCDTAGTVAADTFPLGTPTRCMPIARNNGLAWYLGDDAGNLHLWDAAGQPSPAPQLFTTLPITGLCLSDEADSALFVLTTSDSAALITLFGDILWKIKLSFIPTFTPIALYHHTGNRWDLAAVGSGGEVALLDPVSGAYRPGFPMNAGMAVTAPPVAADFDRDGRQDLLLIGVNRLQAVMNNGALMANWPLILDPSYPQEAIQSPPVIATLSNQPNALPRVLFGWPGGKLDARDNYGNQPPEFPRQTAFTVRSAPLLMQLDDDLESELAVLDESGWLHVYNLANMGAWDVHKKYWNGLANGNSRQGLSVAGPATAPQDNRLLNIAKVYPWPNPARDVSHIRYKMGQTGKITVRIFDVAGDLIEEISASTVSGQEADLEWNLSGVSSGVYIGRVEAESNGQTEKTFIKIAVVK